MTSGVSGTHIYSVDRLPLSSVVYAKSLEFETTSWLTRCIEFPHVCIFIRYLWGQ